jgi:hypothetical protein
MPITVATRSKTWTVFARLNTEIVGSNPTWGMDVCVRLFCVCTVLYARQRHCDGLILRPSSPSDYVKAQETEKAAKAQQRAVEP